VLIRRLLNLLGIVAVAVGLGTLVYAHIAVAPELERSVGILRRVTDDAAATIGLLAQTAAATDAVRPPSRDVTTTSVEAMTPAIVMLDALADTLQALPGVEREAADVASGSDRGKKPAGRTGPDGATGLSSGLAKLGRAVDDLNTEARRLRTASRELDAQMKRHQVPSLQPSLTAAAARIQEMQDILTRSDPARGLLLVDLVAGIYLVMGATLLTVARTLGS
jgi:hypothetical protein